MRRVFHHGSRGLSSRLYLPQLTVTRMETAAAVRVPSQTAAALCCVSNSSLSLSSFLSSSAVTFKQRHRQRHRQRQSSSLYYYSTTVNLQQRRTGTKERSDPFARRPTAKCDPYGQGGKPLSWEDAQTLLQTVEPQWSLWKTEKNDANTVEEEIEETSPSVASAPPYALVREFWHDEYMTGAQFVTHVSAVAQMNDHYPLSVSLERIIIHKGAWRVRTRVVLRTFVLQGLSHHDFFLATLLDVEIQRPEVKRLLSNNDDAPAGS